MNANTQIEADDEEVEVVANANTCAEGNLLAEVFEGELTARLVLTVAQKPHIACIEEGSTIQLADDGEAILHVCFQLEIAHLVDVRVLRLLGMVSARAYCAHAESTDAIGTANGEKLAIGCRLGIAVTIDEAAEG